MIVRPRATTIVGGDPHGIVSFELCAYTGSCCSIVLGVTLGWLLAMYLRFS